MIDFELSADMKTMRDMINSVAKDTMRPISRQFDEEEHTDPTDWQNMMWEVSKGSSVFGGGPTDKKERSAGGNGKPSERNVGATVTIEELSWGDAGLYLSIPNAGLGGAAVSAAGTPEQKKRFLQRFSEGKPKWAAMAITEPGFGSDTAAVATTAVRDGDQWVLNGTKIYCTSGQRALDKSEGFVVVWATVDKSAGRAGIKAFVVDHGTPGVTVTKVEDKLGIRASDTAVIVLEDARIPFDNILGDPEVETGGSKKGFKGAMATFDATRPAVAASAIGIGRAAVDFVRDELAKGGDRDSLRMPTHQADRDRARLHGHGSQPASGSADDLARGLDDGSRHEEQPRIIDVQIQGRPRRDQGDAEGGRDPRAARILAQAAARKVDA